MRDHLYHVAFQHLYLPDDQTSFQQVLCNGALLFVLSDSLLALNKFYHPLRWPVLASCSPIVQRSTLLSLELLVGLPGK
jgi:hypothetical protein